MIKKIISLFLFFYLLVLVQTSFLVHFSLKGMVFNLVFFTIIIIGLFAHERWFALTSALIGGLYLDIFSLHLTAFFGFYTLSSIVLTVFIRLVLRKYVKFPVIKRAPRQKNPLGF